MRGMQYLIVIKPSHTETEYRPKWCMQSRYRRPKPTNVKYLYLLVGISPPCIRRGVCATMKNTKQETNEATLYGQHPAERSLKSMNCYLCCVKPPTVIWCNEWFRSLQTLHKVSVNLSESLTRGYDGLCITWMCLNRLCTGFICSKEQTRKWGGGGRGYFEVVRLLYFVCTMILSQPLAKAMDHF